MTTPLALLQVNNLEEALRLEVESRFPDMTVSVRVRGGTVTITAASAKYGVRCVVARFMGELPPAKTIAQSTLPELEGYFEQARDRGKANTQGRIMGHTDTSKDGSPRTSEV